MDYISRREREKQINKADIIDVAEKIFCEKGYASASMDEIAKQAGFTKRTIYQYFLNKQDLYFAVACKKYQAVLDAFVRIEKTEVSGFQKLHDFVSAYYQFYKDDPVTFLMLKYCPLLKTNDDESPFYNRMEQMKDSFLHIIIETIEIGKKDKSVRDDLDSTMSAYVVFHFTMGFFYRIVEIDPDDLRLNDHNPDEFIPFALNLLVNIFKSKETSE